MSATNYFVEHLRDLRAQALAKAREGYMRETTRQLMTVMDRVSLAKENLRQQARDLSKRVGYCFMVDLKDINERYANLETPTELDAEVHIILQALTHEFPGMDTSVSCTQHTVTYTVFAQL